MGVCKSYCEKKIEKLKKEAEMEEFNKTGWQRLSICIFRGTKALQYNELS